MINLCSPKPCNRAQCGQHVQISGEGLWSGKTKEVSHSKQQLGQVHSLTCLNCWIPEQNNLKIFYKQGCEPLILPMAWTTPCPEELTAAVQTLTMYLPSGSWWQSWKQHGGQSALTQQPTDLHSLWITLIIAVALVSRSPKDSDTVVLDSVQSHNKKMVPAPESFHDKALDTATRNTGEHRKAVRWEVFLQIFSLKLQFNKYFRRT